MNQGVVFDMDGVIFDTEALGRKMWTKAAEEMGVPDMESTYLKVIGINRVSGNKVLKEVYGEDFNVDDFRTLAVKNEEEYKDKYGIPLKKGAIDVLKSLKEDGRKIALASSTSIKSVYKNLARAEITDYFEFIIGGDEIKNGKPDPEIFLKACEKIGLAPSQCIGVEDSYNGVRASANAGLTTIMVPDLLPPTPEMKERADYIATDLFDALKWIRMIDR